MNKLTKLFDKEYFKTWFKAALVRAVKTVAQTLAASLPAGFAITPTMIKNADWTVGLVILAWLGTGLIAGVASLLTSIAGLPEVTEVPKVEENN